MSLLKKLFAHFSQSTPDLKQASAPPRAVCPYCQHQLDKFPSRKSKCPACGNTYFVRTDPDTRLKLVLTESQVKENDQKWKMSYAANDFGDSLRSLVGDASHEQLKHKLKAELETKFNKIPTESDLQWAASNAILQEAIKRNDVEAMTSIYWNQAIFLHREGRDCSHVKEALNRVRLHEYLKEGVADSVEIITCKEASCEACRKLEGKILSIKDALEQKPLPCKECSFEQENGFGWCRCLYGPHIMDEWKTDPNYYRTCKKTIITGVLDPLYSLYRLVCIFDELVCNKWEGVRQVVVLFNPETDYLRS